MCWAWLCVMKEWTNITKAVEWAIVCARNEAEDIRGWAKTMLYFADHVICCLDPASTDNTAQILIDEFPDVQLIYQNRTLGDSDNAIQGDNKVLIAHKNLEFMINEFVQEGEWVLMQAPDERFDPADWKQIADMVRFIRTTPYQAISFPSIHTFAPGSATHCIDYYDAFAWGQLIQIKFMRKVGYWHKDGPPHSGYDVPDPFFTTTIPLYHYCWLKHSRKAYKTWRDQTTFKQYPLYTCPNPMIDWRNLGDIRL